MTGSRAAKPSAAAAKLPARDCAAKKKCRASSPKPATATAARLKTRTRASPPNRSPAGGVKPRKNKEPPVSPPPQTSMAAAAEVAEREAHLGSSCWEAPAWWSSWGVEEELLLGWFPFVEEHFVNVSDNRGGGATAEISGDDDDVYQNIWRLQHIHEIPSSVGDTG